MTKKTLICLIIILIFALFGVKALFTHDYFTSHDGWHQVARLYYFHQSLSEGIFPPSYVSDLYNGYGYPLFIFNYHLPWYLGSFLLNFGLSVFDSIKAIYITGYILSGLTMFYYLRSRFNLVESVVGSIIYLWTPYRFSNIFVRGSVGEATLFIFIPLAFYAIDRLMEKFTWKSLMIGSISIAALLLSHAIGALLIIGFLFFYVLIQAVFAKDKKFLIRAILLLLTGFILTSYYLIPAYALKKDTVFNEKIQGTKFDGQSATLGELVYSKWGYGFANSDVDRMSFQVGIINWAVFLATVIIITFHFKRIFRKNPYIISLLLTFVISVFMITPYSDLVWNLVFNKLFFVDFHWRILVVSVFVSSIFSAFLLSQIRRKLILPAFFIILAICLYTNRNHLRVNQYTSIPLDLYLNSELSTNTYHEYLPKLSDSDYGKASKEGGLLVYEDQRIAPLEKTLNTYIYNVESNIPAQATINLFYFPGWQVFINGEGSPITIRDKGLIGLTIPQGQSTITLIYKNTTIMNISKFISLGTFLLLLYLVYKEQKRV